jgi:hypothetical protein
MATEKQKQAARQNLKKARAAQSARDQAWKRIKAAAKRFDVEVEADDWRELSAGGKARKR